MKARPGRDEESCVFGKLYAATHVRSDRWYKLGRTLLYGRLEDEKPFHSVRRLVQYEDYMLRLFSDAGLPVPHPLGIVEITPEREYLLVTEFFDGAREVGEAEIDDAVIDQGLPSSAGCGTPAWPTATSSRPTCWCATARCFVIDSAFAEVRPSPWRQAVDLANMMLVLALRTDAERVYRRARLQFSDEEIAEAFAATRGLTMPTQLRRMLRQQGRDLHGDFLRLLPYRLPPVRIQRWTWRRVGAHARHARRRRARDVADHRTSSGRRCERRPRGRRSCWPSPPSACCRLRRRQHARRRAAACEEGDDGAPSNGVVLMAQSVPTASWVPCLGRHAAGLALHRHGRPQRLGALLAGLRPRRRRGHRDAADRVLRHRGRHGDPQRPARACAGFERVTQVSPTYMGSRYYVFEGGCITVVFRLSGENRGEPLAVATQGIGAVPPGGPAEPGARGERRPAGAGPGRRSG